jgi:hypothetical protein
MTSPPPFLLLWMQSILMLSPSNITMAPQKAHGTHPGLRMCKKNKSNARKRSGDNENAILWTPLLTPFAQMDTLGPKGLGFLLYGGRAERDLKGHLPVRRVVLVGCLVGPLLFDLGLKGGLEFAHLFSRPFALDGRRKDNDAVTRPRGLKGGLEFARLSSRPVDRDGLEVKATL